MLVLTGGVRLPSPVGMVAGTLLSKAQPSLSPALAGSRGATGWPGSECKPAKCVVGACLLLLQANVQEGKREHAEKMSQVG